MSSIIGLILALFGQLMQLPTALLFQHEAAATTTQITTAQQQKQLMDAATPYVNQNYSTIVATASATNPVVITVAQLVAANVGPNSLPATFNALNPYGQTWQVQVLQPTSGNLVALVMASGGTQLTDLEGASIAAKVGVSGGFIPQNDSGIYTGGASRAYGNQANWNISTAGFKNVGGGQPAALLAFNNGQLQNPSLYRVAVPGQPQLNTMQTDLDMGANNINNANAVKAQSVVTPGGSNQKSVQVGNSFFYGDGANSAVRQAGGLYVQHTDGSAADISQVNNVTANGNIWAGGALTAAWVHSTGSAQIDGSTVSNGRITSGEYVQANGYGPVGGWCSNAGQMGQDGAQTTLCKNNQWVAAGGGLSQSNCGWAAIPGGGVGNTGFFTYTCPNGWYIAGYGNYREGDWTRTGEAQVYCCQAS